ncbi:MARVEL domain-containing protein 3 [Brachionichthys hirsutus]|uniref:MARVEL domain-containing protein 3 n=1 Tax=Brachionichthys hirsutus TaxID=412623 RepID=UPI0036049ACF
MSQPPRANRGHRERNGAHRDANDDRSSSRPPYYPGGDPPPRDVPRVEHRQSSCSNICSRRGIVLICSALTNALVLICLVSAHVVTSGLSSAGGFGGFDINSNLNLEGAELQEARELDAQYSQLRAPGVYGGVAFSLTLGVLSLLFVVAGNKPPHLMSRRLLFGALAFQAAGAVAYVVAVGLYLHFIIGVNATDVCARRARLYARRGHTWMNCDVGGADAGVALFGLITAILYAAGTVLTVQTVRGVGRYLKERSRREAERHRDRDRDRDRGRPARADTTSV